MSERSRLRWRCRRGTQELDTILGRFLDAGYDSLDESGARAFDRLLECEDDDLIDWFLNAHEPSDPALRAIVVAVRQASGV
ncbi:MAG: succinate dehydrogenase assembly factor 2 [Ectothiorhodospiraceae bacterium]|jgi:antitoxin CptB